MGLLAASILWAMAEKSVFEGFAVVLAQRWGLVATIDLYAGLLFAGAWIASRERRVWVVVLWAIGLFCLGNLATLGYVILRARHAREWRELFAGN